MFNNNNDKKTTVDAGAWVYYTLILVPDGSDELLNNEFNHCIAITGSFDNFAENLDI